MTPLMVDEARMERMWGPHPGGGPPMERTFHESPPVRGWSCDEAGHVPHPDIVGACWYCPADCPDDDIDTFYRDLGGEA